VAQTGFLQRRQSTDPDVLMHHLGQHATRRTSDVEARQRRTAILERHVDGVDGGKQCIDVNKGRRCFARLSAEGRTVRILSPHVLHTKRQRHGFVIRRHYELLKESI